MDTEDASHTPCGSLPPGTPTLPLSTLLPAFPQPLPSTGTAHWELVLVLWHRCRCLNQQHTRSAGVHMLYGMRVTMLSQHKWLVLAMREVGLCCQSDIRVYPSAHTTHLPNFVRALGIVSSGKAHEILEYTPAHHHNSVFLLCSSMSCLLISLGSLCPALHSMLFLSVYSTAQERCLL